MHLAKRPLFVAVSLATASVVAWAALPAVPANGSFDDVDLHLEVDMGSFSGELSLQVESSQGLVELSLADSTGKSVLRMVGYDLGENGAASVAVESRTDDVRDVFERFPVGTYTVTGLTAGGALLQDEVWLSHAMPSRFQLQTPVKGEVVPVEDLFMRWNASVGANRYHLEIEGASGELALEIWLPATETSFVVPAQFLKPGETYEYSLNSEGTDGNELEVEGSFSTRPRSNSSASKAGASRGRVPHQR